MKQSNGVKFLVRVCFMAYLIILLYLLLVAERSTSAGGMNTVLFAEITRYLFHIDTIGVKQVIINLGGNVVGFIPFGYLLPRWNNRFDRFYMTCGCCFSFSLTVEVIQLVTRVGCFDVDDVFLNTLGGILGYILYACHRSVRSRQSGTKKKIKK
ncbi:MAG: VanZ family protein [Lachnospiraceae bacterium]|nr:VanZ family protein [Lachnospiraceae bacterium]